MSGDSFDYSGYTNTDAAPTHEVAAELATLVSELAEAEIVVAKLEKQLKAAKKTVTAIEEGTLPEKMAELGFQQTTLRNGLTVSVIQKLFVSLPKKNPDKFEAGIQWFIANGYGKILKEQLIADFGKGKAKEAAALAKKFEEEGFPVTLSKSVHASTLKAFFKNYYEEGNDDPEVEKLFNIHRVSVAKVK